MSREEDPVKGWTRILAAVTVWLAIVGVGSGLAWLVISQVGEDIGPQGVSLRPAGPEAAATGSRRPRPSSTPTAKGLRSPRATPSSSPSGSPPSSPSAPATTVASGAPTLAPTPTPTTVSAAPTPSAHTSTPAPEPTRDSWAGAAGEVVGQCRGTSISLVAAQPSVGWSVEVDHRGPEEIKVKFERSGEREGEVEVTGRCLGGAPRFTAETSGDS